MFNMKDLGDMAKLASEAKEMQRQQDLKHREQVNLLSRISTTLDQILHELKKTK
jgi:hypothetical protein